MTKESLDNYLEEIEEMRKLSEELTSKVKILYYWLDMTRRNL